MTGSRNILRQITDIQIQADRLIKNKPGMTEIERFSDYNSELKTFLLENVDEEFIVNHISQIPDLDSNESDVQKGIFAFLFYTIAGFLGIYSAEQQKINQSLSKIRDIQGKYASAEFMLKNYFS